jgi:hypothetical protein
MSTLAYQLTLDDRMSGALRGAQGNLANFGSQVASLAASFAGLTAGALSLHGMVEKLFGALERGAGLAVLSRQTGQTVSDLVKLQAALKQAGLDSGMAGTALWQLQRALGGVNEQGEPTKHVFQQLGLSLEHLQQMRAIEALQAISEKMAALPTPAARAFAAMQMFGRSGREMLALLADPGAFSRAATTGIGWALPLADAVCAEYGWGLDTVLDMPLQTLFALRAAAQIRKGAEWTGPSYEDQDRIESLMSGTGILPVASEQPPAAPSGTGILPVDSDVPAGDIVPAPRPETAPLEMQNAVASELVAAPSAVQDDQPHHRQQDV